MCNITLYFFQIFQVKDSVYRPSSQMNLEVACDAVTVTITH